MLTVHEVSKLTGVSVRTLHYYDEIGLLAPAKESAAGYRLYDEAALKRLQNIMLFKELEFPLKDIKKIIDSPNFDQAKAIEDQIKLLELRRDHLDGLIDLARRIKLKEETQMNFDAFDKSKIVAYERLAKEVWGDTNEYKEYEAKSAQTSDTEKRQAAEDLMNIFFEFGELMGLPAGDAKVQAMVKKLQDFITANYYTCSNKILAGLGQMYVAGGEMTDNINVAGGNGCADFVAEAIQIYCK